MKKALESFPTISSIRPTWMWEVLEMQEQLFSRPTWMWEVLEMQEQLFSRPTWMWEVLEMQEQLFSRPTWQGLFLQSYCISSIHGGQMWEVQKMHMSTDGR